MTELGIHWFRRDLRVEDNLALAENLRELSGKTLCIFVIDPDILRRKDISLRRFQFILDTLGKLKISIENRGGSLLILKGKPELEIVLLIDRLQTAKTFRVKTLTFNRDYEPFALKRDLLVVQQLQKMNIAAHSYKDHLIVEPTEISKDNGLPYTVFTPFANKWRQISWGLLDQRPLIKQKVQFLFSLSELGKISATDALAEMLKSNSGKCDIELPAAGYDSAITTLEKFGRNISHYHQQRDFPNMAGTSRLSPYLKTGTITSRQLCDKLKLGQNSDQGKKIFLSELIWREFYYSILSHFPRVETGAFHEHYQNIHWKNSKAHFQRWKEGTTGFPIVDAGMRQLEQTGWMHNRVRMIVASFLCKDLLINWQWGEEYFMTKLIDGDLAANNGGWQWAASTGCDPQPYFRIFNPWLQSKKFDPDGEYICKYIPELRGLPAKALHDPSGDRFFKGYPQPIVDHSRQRMLSLLMYKEARK